MRELKGIPDAVKRWAFCEMPGVKAFMVYKKKGRRAEAFCTCCGAYVEGITEAVSLEDEAETLIRPEHNTESRCPRCHVIGQWKAKGRMTRSCFRTFYYIFGQKIKDDFVFRACTCTLTIFPDTICQIEDSEYARVYLSKGKKAEKWWHVCRYGEWQWVDWYPGYFGSGGITRDHYYPGTYDSIRKTPMLKYGNPRSWDPIDYYSAFARYPDMEMVQKLGMDDLTRALIYQRGANINPRGKTIWDRLRINKDRLKDLQKKKGSIFYLKTYQLERKEGNRLSDEQIDQDIYIQKLWSADDKKTMRRIFTHCSLKKYEAYLDAQTKIRDKRPKTERYYDVRTTYLDYIRMRLERGYDLSNDIILFPKDLKRRHDEMVEEARAKEAEARIAKMNEKWPQIEKKFTKLNKKFYYANGDYLIRPAKEAGEISEEGRTLHHCVGTGDKYYEQHAKGQSFILFLRKASEPDKPFATIEISGSRILQWYEAYDKKPDAEVLQPWLDDYTKHLARKNRKKKAAAG